MSNEHDKPKLEDQFLKNLDENTDPKPKDGSSPSQPQEEKAEDKKQ